MSNIENFEATNWDVQGNTIYLDRHDPNCGNKKGMTKWHLTHNGKGKVRVNYGCVDDHRSGNAVNHYTGWNDSGGNNHIFMDRHNVDCGHKAITNMKWSHNGKKGRKFKVRFNYKCGTSAGKDCEEKSTKADEIGNNYIYLDRHNVTCPQGKYLSRWKLQNAGGNKMRVDYRCCAPTELPQARPEPKPLVQQEAADDDAPVAESSGGGFCTIL